MYLWVNVPFVTPLLSLNMHYSIESSNEDEDSPDYLSDVKLHLTITCYIKMDTGQLSRRKKEERKVQIKMAERGGKRLDT